MSSGIDPKKLKRVPAAQVPAKAQKRGTQWDEVFASIKKGEAIVLEREDAAPSTIRDALKRYQSKGRFTELYTTTRKVGKDYVTYVVRPDEEHK